MAQQERCYFQAMNISTKSEFLSKVTNQNAAVLFYSTQQPQSKQMSTVLELLAADYSFEYFRVALDGIIDKVRSDWDPVKVTTPPLVVLFKDKTEVGRVDGADPPTLVNLIEQLCKGELAQNNVVTTNSTLESQLEALINSSPVMLFMKGEKHSPFCRFSKQAVAILNQLSVDFNSFDIFSDCSVREGLKEYSQWPTFPQLYVKGELIGGVDIMHEMLDDGSLAKLLAEFTSKSINDRLRTLIKRQPIMVFMKGDRESPFCRFSRQLMELLAEAGCTEFGTFNILEDEEVREGLKVYSEWPTYPQIYVNGKLLGGVDIVKEILNLGGRGALLEEIHGMMAD